MTAWVTRPRGVFERRLRALSLGLAVLFGLYLFALPSGARAATGEPTIPVEAAGAVGSAVSPGGQDPEALSSGENQTAPAGTSAGIGDQQASTEQAATADAAANQQQPTNIVVSVRINSPGDDGPITQGNVAVAVGEGTNDSSTAQGGGVGDSGGQAGAQDASTGQTASSTATATQDQAGNVVISIRINSPGDNGPISQTNTAAAASNAGNTSTTNTNQGVPAGGAQSGSDGSSAGDPPVAIGPPAQQQQSGAPGSTPPAAPSRLIPLPAPVEASTARAASRPTRTVPARPGSAPTKAHRPTGTGVAAGRPAVSKEQWSPSSPTARPRLHQRSSARHKAALHRGHPAATAHGFRRRAADLFGSIAPSRALPVTESSKDVSSAVVLTLIAVLGAVLIFAAAYLSSGRRLVDPRKWRAR
jgi:hypothetical protein